MTISAGCKRAKNKKKTQKDSRQDISVPGHQTTEEEKSKGHHAMGTWLMREDESIWKEE